MKKLYTIVFLVLCWVVQAQTTPGGVTTPQLEYWLRADDLSDTFEDEQDVNLWKDASGFGRDFESINAFMPRFIKSSLNYHSSVEFYTTGENGATINDKKRKLVSVSPFQTDTNKSYYVFYVSNLNNDDSSARSTVLGLSGGTKTNYGWKAGAGEKSEIWFSTDGTDYVHNINNNQTVGIVSAIVPNKTGGNGLSQQFYFNGSLPVSITRKRMEISNTKSSIGGSSITAAGDLFNFFGEVMEVIVLTDDVGTDGKYLSASDFAKVHTYLSLKYGIGLGTGFQNYILSDDSSVLDLNSALFAGYQSNVFGLVRDDASDLYQKQSSSVQNGSLAVSIGEFAETNKENIGVLQNKSAILFAANGQSGNQVYDWGAGTVFKNYTLETRTDPLTGKIKEERFSNLFNYKIKVKTTGIGEITVNTRVSLGTWLMVSDSDSFVPSQTKVYKVVDGQVKDLVLKDGDYIGFGTYMSSPGGVANGLRMWLNASMRETLTLNGEGQIINWVDYSGRGTTYRRYEPNKSSPLYVAADPRTNFHPTPLFRTRKDYLVTDKAAMSVASPSNVAFYAVVNHNFASSRSYFIGFGAHKYATNARRPAFGVIREGSSGLVGKGRIGATGLVNSKNKLFNAGATTIAGYHWNVSNNITFEFDGKSDEQLSFGFDNIVMNGQGMLGLGSSSELYYLQGVMPEAILYERALDSQEKLRINSYLGLKYGSTLRVGNGNFDYFLSDGSSIWDGNATVNKRFHNNVAAVVRDDNASLENKQSKSTDLGAIVHMGVGKKLGFDPELGEILVDRGAIIWGHNAGTLSTSSFAGNNQICGEMDSKVGGRIWMAQNTNFDQSVLVRADAAEFPYNGSGYQVYLLVADSEAKLSSNNWDLMIPMTYVDGGHQVNYQFKKGAQTFFSFGAKQVPGGCDTCEFDGVKTLSFDKNTWPKGTRNKDFDLGDGFSANVKVSVEGSGNFLTSTYPRASSFKSLRQVRTKGSGTDKMITEINLKQNGNAIAASASFEIFEVDRLGSRTSNVEVYGMCSDGRVVPRLSYSSSKPTFKIQGNKGQGLAASSYTNIRSRMHVEFDTPVDKIFVVHTYTGNSSLMRIGIGPIEFFCPAPLPAPNEDGLVLTKQGPPTMTLCDQATYTFRVTNTNCDPYTVNFTDALPAGMKWVNESLSIEQEELNGLIVNNYAGTDLLDIKNLVIPGGGTYTFRAKAVLDTNASAGIYENRAKITYPSSPGSTQLTEILSCDRLSLGCEPTVTIVTGDPSDRAIPLKVVKFETEELCYSEDGTVNVWMAVKNENDFTFEDLLLEITFNDEFKYNTNPSQTLVSQLGNNITVDNASSGILSISGINIPKGQTTIHFQLIAPKGSDIVYTQEASPKPVPLEITYDWSSESDDACINTSVTDAFGELLLEYCEVCYYPGIAGTPTDILNSNGYMAVSTLVRPDKAWVGIRGNAFMVMESKTKGFVITRLTTTQIAALAPIAGMLVYDTTENCLKMYDGQQWGCLEQGCVDDH